jgi:hypothetical protein
MSTPLDRGRVLLSQAPASPLRAVLMSGGVPDRVELGQLWRARWSDVTVLVLVVDVAEPSTPTVVAVTIGVDVPPGSRAPALALQGPVVRSAVVWPAARLRLPTRTLEVLVEHTAETNTAAAVVLARPEPLDAYDPAADLVADLEDDLAALAAAPGLRVQTDDRAAATTLQDVLPGDTGGKLDALEQALGLTQPAAMARLRAPATLSDADAIALEHHFGLQPGALARSELGFPSALVTELDHPRWRRQLLARVDTNTDELTVRRTVAASAYTLAARESTVLAPNWRERLDIILRA